MTQCHARGSLTVGGREVTSFQCSLDEGHTETRVKYPAWPEAITPATPHKYVLEWCDDDDLLILPDADLFDPDERFDVELPFPEK